MKSTYYEEECAKGNPDYPPSSVEKGKYAENAEEEPLTKELPLLHHLANIRTGITNGDIDKVVANISLSDVSGEFIYINQVMDYIACHNARAIIVSIKNLAKEIHLKSGKTRRFVFSSQKAKALIKEFQKADPFHLYHWVLIISYFYPSEEAKKNVDEHNVIVFPMECQITNDNYEKARKRWIEESNRTFIPFAKQVLNLKSDSNVITCLLCGELFVHDVVGFYFVKDGVSDCVYDVSRGADGGVDGDSDTFLVKDD